MTPEVFLEKLYKHTTVFSSSEEPNVSFLFDFISNHIDLLMGQRKYIEVNQILNHLDIRRVPLLVLLHLLVITKSNKDKLKARLLLFNNVFSLVTYQNDINYAEKLLGNLN